jgi:anaerobic selenocysteine-containing dehydrogenase
MQLLRTMLVWVLVLCLPVEGMAANLMTHCKDMQKAVAGQSMQGMSHHDHAAMMAMDSMSDAEMAAMPPDHAMHGASMKQPAKSLKAGCKCGCKCGGNCAVSCAGMMVSVLPSGFMFNGEPVSIQTVMPRGQAHAAYRYDPLRPPSAVAL